MAASFAGPAFAQDSAAIGHAAHDTYLAAINSNDLDTFVADLTDDVVFQAPGAPEMVGKAAVKAWGADYLGAYRIKWEKASFGFTVNGD